MTDTQNQPQDEKSVQTQAQPNVQENTQVQGGKPGMSAMAIVGLVLGILALVLSLVPIINNFAAILAVLGAIFAIIGIVGTGANKKSGRGLAIAGLVISIISFIAVLGSQALYSAAIDEAINGSSETVVAEVVEEGSASSSANADANTLTTDSNDSAAAGDTYQQATDSDYAVTIDSCKQTKDYSGKAAVVVTYTWTNNSDKATSFMVAITDKAFQDGVQLDTAILGNGDSSNLMKDVKPGKSLQVTQGFLLDSKTEPVTIECSELISFSDALLAKKTFNLK